MNVTGMVERLSERHPELLRPVLWRDVKRFCQREGIALYHVAVPFAGRLVRVGRHVAIQLNRELSERERTIVAMHELAHFWHDDVGEPVYYLDLGDRRQDTREEWADLFAWYVTTPHRPPSGGGSSQW